MKQTITLAFALILSSGLLMIACSSGGQTSSLASMPVTTAATPTLQTTTPTPPTTTQAPTATNAPPSTQPSILISGNLAGNWYGVNKPSQGGSFQDKLILVDDGLGDLSAWFMSAPISGKYLNQASFQMSGSNTFNAFQITGNAQDNILTIDYVVTNLTVFTSYTGTETLIRY